MYEIHHFSMKTTTLSLDLVESAAALTQSCGGGGGGRKDWGKRCVGWTTVPFQLRRGREWSVLHLYTNL